VVTSVAGLSVDVDNICKKRAISSCTREYSPCSCTDGNVVCDQISVADIKIVFSNMTRHDLKSVKIILSPHETEPIPDDILGNVRVTSIELACVENSNLRVSNDAFRASSDESVRAVNIDGCNLSRLDFAFMSYMYKLHSLYIFRSLEFVSFQGLPGNRDFKLMSITESSQFYALDDTPALLFGLEILYLNDNQLDDTEATKLIKSLASTSVDSLTEFRLYNNKLTRIPDMLLSMANLKELSLNNNQITLLSTNSLAFKGPISISLGNNSIRNIRPGAFGSLKSMGTFVTIRLNLNKFNRMDSNVFQTVLEGMALAGEGSLELGESKL
jgi:Leucine-rich repeat (LRR) protein